MSTSESKPSWNDLRDAFVTVKRDYLMKQTQENVSLKEANNSFKVQNTQLFGQVDKLKRLCHLCLNLIMTSSNSTALASTSASTPTVAAHSSQQQPSTTQADLPMDEIELLILEYLYSGPNCSENSHQLVKHFDELISRLAVATANDESTKLAATSGEHQCSQQQQKRKTSLIKRILVKSLSGFQNSSQQEHGRHSRKQSTTTAPHVPLSPANCGVLANSAAAAGHLRPCDSIQKLHEFFEYQQENQRILPKACGDESANEEENQNTLTNSYHLSVAPIKAMNGGIGSPTKSMMATEEHSGAQLSTHIDVNEIVDTTPKMSEVAMFCGLNDNNASNPLLNYAIRKENEKRQQLDKTKGKEGKDGKDKEKDDNISEDFYGCNFLTAYSAPSAVKTKLNFDIGSDDDSGEEGDVSPADSVVDGDAASQTDSLDEMDMEQEMDRILEHIHQHRWFVLPAEAAASSDIVVQLNSEVFDLNNVEAAFQAINRLWLSRKVSTTRLVFFYEMFQFLFDKYLNVVYCDCHHPPCAPSVEASLFSKLAVPILRRFLECNNRSRHLIIQIEMLSSIESLIYNRPHYRPALSEVFHHLFTAGLIECTAFTEWARLEDPSAQFEAANMKNASASQAARSERSPSKESVKSIKSNGKPLPPATPSSANNSTPSNAKTPAQPEASAFTNRERLFQELKKAGFAIFKCKTF